MTRRFDQATTLREFAKRARDIRFRGAERLLEDLDELAKDMLSKANELVRSDEPTPESVFRTGSGASAKGRPFRAEIRRAAAA